MASQQVTRADIDALLAFLPGFEEPERPFMLSSPKSYYPQYPDDVVAFFRLAARPPWTDTGYNPKQAGSMLKDDERVASATLDEVRAMLTFCVRGERFADGHRGSMLKHGRVQALLHRLAELRETVNP